ncbi:gliding motility-associated C-terminal domain-containing protein [Pontibacter litorisediminis]|uniref:T9SS type B sorting domain-containing protein n=1 Tax=Pontibacter litorisediminis TaxID=1846260 RepID=UPI0023EC8FC6|nr:gliding motility-associated C-terminal domain-containing protein [Pontibacter litorisediminis]
MKKTFTRKLSFLFAICLLGVLQFAASLGAFAQKNNEVPIYRVDLRGKPNGVWNSGEVARNGQLCGAPNNENCVQFEILLDQNAEQMEFDIVSGPVPSGSMGYQIDCGPQTPVGQPICVDVSKPITLTLCMPGNAKGVFEVRSLAAFNPQADISVTSGCSATLRAPQTFEAGSITWRDITYNGTYNKYLSFPNGDTAPIITPDNNAPAYVDYEVSGTTVATKCPGRFFSDVVRVYFYPPPTVTIGPNPAIICPGGSGVTLTGQVTGGDGNWEYIWTDPSGNVVGNQLTYTATTVGTHKFEVRNINYPNCREFSASVDVVSNLAANAGPDQLVCSQSPVQLAGTITAATGGIWSGGGGTFSPSNTALNAVYTPTAAEIAAGSVKLRLTSTGNGSCSAVQDEVLITFYPIDVELTGTPVICSGTMGTVTAKVTGGNGTISYKWSSGETTATITGKPAGTYTVTVSDGQSCAVTKSFTVTEVPGPTGFTATTASETCGSSNGSVTVSNVTSGTSPYKYSADGTNYQDSPVLEGLAAGDYVIYVKDANGCTVTKSVTIANIAGPTAVMASAVAASCYNNDGSITVGNVSGGTANYTYSLNNSVYQSATSFTGLAAGTYTVYAKDANGCIVSTSVSVAKQTLTAFTATAASSTCGASNASITVSNVQGGIAPYAYSTDGVNFQDNATLSGLAAGPYTVTVRDSRGCTLTKSVTVGNITGPTDLTATAKPSSCGNSNAEILVTNVSGGTGTYTYSLDGTNFQSAASFTGLAAGNYTIYVKDGNRCVYTEAITLTDIAGPDFTATAQASTCGASNGRITISNITGGVTPYKYSKDGGATFQDTPSFSGLAEGRYQVMVQDANGCSLVKAVDVTNMAGPSDLALASTASTCGDSNGVIRINGVSGGTSPYTYSIDGKTFQESQTFGAVLAGEYTVTVKDANGCTFAKQVVVGNVAGPTNLAASTQASTCGGSNGEIMITGVTGGAGDYTYSKDGVNYQASATLTGFVAGTHTVYVKDSNGCTFSKAFTVSDIAGPTAVAATAQPASCQNNDGSITVGRVTGGTSGYTYAIDGTNFQTSTSFTGLASGKYTVTAKDAKGCIVTTTVTVGQNVPTAFASTTVAASCGRPDGELTIGSVTGGKAPYTYSINGGGFQASATFTNLVAGTYSITVKDAKGCTFTDEVGVQNVEGPSFSATVAATTCGAANGSIKVGNTTGGVGPYTYSIDGQNFQAATTFENLLAGSYTITAKDANGCFGTTQVVVADIAGPEDFTLAGASSTCSGSNATISVSNVDGGTAPYTYSINGGGFQVSATFANLAAGDYTITVKDDNGCTISKAIKISDIPGPSGISLAATASTCGESNGKIEVGGVTGGTAPYTFALDGKTFQQGTTFAAVAAGAYTVTVKDANGCTFAAEVVVTNIGGPSDLTASATSSTCGSSNGKLTVTGATGGDAPYTYSKDGVNFQESPVFENLLAGSHTLYVKDSNGCTFSKAFTVSDIAGPTAVAATAQPASCQNNDGSITVGRVTGGTSGYTYAIDGTNFQTSTSFTGLASGKYTVTAKDAKGCIVTTTVTVGQNVPTAFANSTLASTCGARNASITVGTVTGGTAPYTYSVNGSAFQTSATLANLAAGTYTVTVKDAKGCTFSQAVTVADIAGPSALALAGKASTCGSTNAAITVSGVTGGTAPYTFALNGGEFQSGTSFGALPAGEYTVTVKDANGCTFVQAVTLTDIPGPSAFTATATASSCGRANGSITVNGVTGGTAPYTYSADGASFQEAATLTSLLAGKHTVTVKDANGCTVTMDVVVEDVAGPNGLELASTASTCGASNGSIAVGKVSGGTAPYMYSLDNTSFQSGLTFEGVRAGNHTVTVKDANGCTFSASITVTDIAGPANFTASTKATTCGASNGEISITGVTNGTAPYTYSIDGKNFQAAATFAGLAAGSHNITVKDANGCTFVKAVEVTNIEGPASLAATTKAASCADNDGGITVGAVTGGTAPYTYSINGTTFQGSTSFTGLASGEYILTVKDANGCQTTETVKVRKDGPASFASTTAASTCGAENGRITVVSVDGGKAPYTYSINGGSFQSSAAFTSLLAGAYRVTVKDANNCTYIQEVVVTNIEGPSDLTVAANTATCGNSNGQISIAGVTGGTAPYTYSADGVNFQASATISGLAAGEYQVTVKDANGCTAVKAVTVGNASGPEGFTVAGKAATCGAANGEATVSAVVGGKAPYTYSANGTSFQPEATLKGLTAGTHTITVKDANGCTFTKQVVIENVAGPANYELATVATTCGAANGVITVSNMTGGTAPYTYALNNGDYQAAATFTEVAAGEYAITVKDANGCTLVKQVEVRDVAGPTEVAASTTPTACTANNGTITVTGVTGGKAPYTYSLDGSTYQAAATFGALAAGEYEVYVKDANGCSTTAKVTVGIKGPKEATVAATKATCGEENGSITITAVTDGTKPLAYSINGGSFQASASFANLAAGVYTIIIKDAEGCTLEVTQEVSNSGAATFTATGSDASCGAENGRIVISGVSGGVSPYTYSVDGTNFQGSPEFTGLAEGAYQVSVKDAAGCLSFQPVTIGNTPPITNLRATVTSPTCEQPAGQVAIDEVSGGTAPYTYSLDGSNFTASTTLADVAPGNYTLTVKDAAGCTYSIEVQVEEGVSSKLDYVHHLACTGGNTGEIAFTSTGATDQTQYSIDNGKTFQKSAVFSGLAAGTYQLIAKFSATCTINVGTVEVKEAQEMEVEATALTKAIGFEKSGSAAVTKIVGGVGPYTYSLDGGAFTSDSVFTNLSAREYTVTVKDSRGCTATTTFVIEGQGDIDIPNGFTPNGDGINDTWVLKNLPSLFPGNRVTVYNRWGSEVFSSRGYSKPWDGTYKGKRLPDGTYYCIIELGDGSAPIKTSVTIMR